MDSNGRIAGMAFSPPIAAGKPLPQKMAATKSIGPILFFTSF
jgi:hypothetical protein